eukprot:CAMPEP_0176114268 /NCGR_PEP_ID=MMETSP0120_2-20121206/57382_1 /TAXON_ID=160619 /ORGANISM="Kryptoperidinium foliaceum, Strain CCMP 1326" /LENGTH=60 /DNA_ID=CAMNT_0017448497 /DNA_START=85 /DNA_END=264 /DNA_ORIENTATION=+
MGGEIVSTDKAAAGEGKASGKAKVADAAPRAVWPLWKLILIALPQLGVQVLWCFIGPNSA